MQGSVLVQFDNTPKALASPSPGLERSDTPGISFTYGINPERVPLKTNPVRVLTLIGVRTQGFAMLEPWAEISERLRRNFKLMHTFKLMHYLVSRIDTLQLNY